MNSQPKELESAVLKTLVWFDIFSYPPTAYELWQYLAIKISLSDFLVFLQSNPTKHWQEQQGFYCLRRREEIIAVRLNRYNFSDRKFKIALRVSAFFRLLPFVKMIALANIIGANNLRKGSDIDLFIVTAPGRLWLSRLFCAGLAKIFHLRPNRHTKQDKICLSFYISEDQLDLRAFRLDEDDIYFKYWLAGLIPIYDRGGVYDNLLAANSWLSADFPNFIAAGPHPRRYLPLKKLLANLPIFNSWEKKARNWQMKIMPSALKNLINKDSRVIVSDRVIKLYLVDRREDLRKELATKLKTYGEA
jgi:hypothetical protein